LQWYSILLAIVLLISAGPSPKDIPVDKEIIKNVTQSTSVLESLSAPAKRYTIAIYRIDDKTGQYKENGYGSNSRAVTQGATEMLITALTRSHQFSVVDRVDFQRLMNENSLGRKTPDMKQLIPDVFCKRKFPSFAKAISNPWVGNFVISLRSFSYDGLVHQK